MEWSGCQMNSTEYFFCSKILFLFMRCSLVTVRWECEEGGSMELLVYYRKTYLILLLNKVKKERGFQKIESYWIHENDAEHISYVL